MTNTNEGGIPSDLVHNKDYLENISNVSKCSICQRIMINPQECHNDECDKTFCLSCINDSKNCPGCEKGNFHPCSKGIRTLLSNLQIWCNIEGCNEKVKYDSYVTHLQNCTFKVVQCKECNENIKKKDEEEHMKTCSKKILNEVNDNDNENHQENLDENTKVKSNDLETINKNIEKIIKDQEEKFVKFESVNQKLHTELKEKMKIFVERLGKSKGSSEPTNKEKEIENLINQISGNIVDGVSEKLNINDINIDIGEKFQNFLVTLSNNPKQDQDVQKTVENFLKLTENNIIKNLESVKNQILKETNTLIISNIKSAKSNKESVSNGDSGYDLSSLKVSVQTICANEDKNTELLEKLSHLNKGENDITPSINLNQFTLSLNQKILENLDEKIAEIKKNFQEINSTIPDKIKEQCEKIRENIGSINNQSKELKTFINENISEISTKYINLMEKFIKEISEKVKKEGNSSTANNTSEKVNRSEPKASSLTKEELEVLIKAFFEDYNKSIEKEIKTILEEKTRILKENLKELRESVTDNSENEKLKILQNNYEGLSDQINELPNTIENMKTEFSQKLQETLKSMNLMNRTRSDQKENISMNTTKRDSKYSSSSKGNLNSLIEKMVTDNLENKLSAFQSRIEVNFSRKLKSMYELKYCRECKKVDYFFGFTKCDHCKSENCKQCVLLCKGCKKLYCKKCISCSKCGSLYCEKCKHKCIFCSDESKEKYCTENCIKECLYCHREICVNCIKTCMNCKNIICSDCSKFCKVCENCSCSRCETASNFKYCFYCKGGCCKNCMQLCKFCDLEICSKCYSVCKNCKKAICRKCGKDCNNCNEMYCSSCEKTLLTIKCNHCRKNFCNLCQQNVKKCKQCGTTNCKGCCSVCRKCKTSFCNSCNINCDNCEEYSCSGCLYKCVCDQIVFCEQCVFGTVPIGPHECVLFLNDAPSFAGIKTRSKIPLPKNFEAKFYLERFENSNLLIGVTDNFYFEQDSITYIDNIWTMKVKTGEKYSSEKSLEKLYDKGVKEKQCVIVAIKNNQLYFRIDYDDTLPAYVLPPGRVYYIYLENDTPNLVTRVHFVYIRKI